MTKKSQSKSGVKKIAKKSADSQPLSKMACTSYKSYELRNAVIQAASSLNTLAALIEFQHPEKNTSVIEGAEITASNLIHVTDGFIREHCECQATAGLRSSAEIIHYIPDLERLLQLLENIQKDSPNFPKSIQNLFPVVPLNNDSTGRLMPTEYMLANMAEAICKMLMILKANDDHYFPVE